MIYPVDRVIRSLNNWALVNTVLFCMILVAYAVNKQSVINFCPNLSLIRSTASWPLEPPSDAEGWRHVRLQQAGKNASGQTHYLSLSGFELYGTVVGAVEEALGRPLNFDFFESFHVSGKPPPTPPLTQFFLTYYHLEQNVGLGKGRWGVSQKHGVILFKSKLTCPFPTVSSSETNFCLLHLSLFISFSSLIFLWFCWSWVGKTFI